MKIGILTLNGHFNYGNRLQNYALQTLLESLNADIKVDTIWFTENNYILDKQGELYSIKNLRRYFFNRHGYRHLVDSNNYFNKYIREYNIKKFSDRWLNIKYDYQLKKGLNEEYDYFVVGSDQIWNPFWVKKGFEFLSFADKHKRISYSASLGVSEMPKEKEAMFTEGLNGMAYISVREHAGAQIVKQLTGKDVPVLLDPTLTLTGEQWGRMCCRPAWFKDEKYILVFFLSKISPLAKSEIERLAKENNFKIIELMDETNIDYYTSSPEEFLFLIKNASLVYTDSFHCTVFSILFGTVFVNCSRENVGMNMDSRMDTLLKLFGLENRKTDRGKNYTVENPLEINYPDVEKILKSEREKSKKYLSNALGIRV